MKVSQSILKCTSLLLIDIEDHETEQALRDGDDGGGGAHLTEDNEYEDGNA